MMWTTKTDQTARMCRLICVVVVHTSEEGTLSFFAVHFIQSNVIRDKRKTVHSAIKVIEQNAYTFREGNSGKNALHFFDKRVLFKYIENFTTKNRKFSDENHDILYISAQNID